MQADKTTPPAEPEADENALDAPATEVENLDTGGADSSVIDATGPSPKLPSGPPKKSFRDKLRAFNLYLILFLFILVLAGGIATVAYFQSKKVGTTSTIKAQTLTQQTLEQVASGDATVGNAQQVLNVESSAVFAGKVLIRDGLEVAGNLQVGGTLAVSNISISGTSDLGQVQVSQDLAVAGNTALQGTVSISKSLQVTGTGNFGGALSAPQITTSSLQLNSDLVLTHHITTGGGTPSRSNGPALGSGGTASISGSDTGGSVSINTGSSPAAGCFVTISFTAKYNATPHVLLTPVGSAGGGLAYYVNRDASSFSICDASTPPAGSSFGFDYFVVD